MVKNAITVFARVKPEKNRKNVVNYDIHRRPKKHLNEDFLVITAPQKLTEYIDNRPESWNFSIFEHKVPQDEVFASVARPVIDSVFDGYNATIFTYGQTGSGKTYTITGEVGIPAERGIIPRTLRYIFDIVQKNPENLYTVEVAYLEIYNENGYDLLLERKEREAATRLEDLPRVTIQEDESGTMHLKNLSIRIVRNEEEALQLLIDGDTYRAISDTPMNPRSSRSHCIFTIVISVKKFGADRYSRAKMHLVDLAGSERVYKCAIQGTILTEAKHINLSLHFLEQVIVCLGQDNVTHVPYRNSLLTSVLRDSLGGNCLTTMLATISVSNFNLEETISTCRFAQRVALVKNDVNLTFEIDTKSENILLKMENEKLRRQIEELKNRTVSQVSNFGSAEYYKDLVVQRDQEISHLIELLKKEKSRRKSVTKEILRTKKELSKDGKYTQSPSNRSPRNGDHEDESSKIKIVGNIENFRQQQHQSSPEKIKSQGNDMKQNLTSLKKIEQSQVCPINIPALNLKEENNTEEKLTYELDRPKVESDTLKIYTTDPIDRTIITKNSGIKASENLSGRDIQAQKTAKIRTKLDNENFPEINEFKKPQMDHKMSRVDISIAENTITKHNECPSIESPKLLTEIDSQTSREKKCNVEKIEHDGLKKTEMVDKCSIHQRLPEIDSNIPGTKNNQTTESPKSKAGLDTQKRKNGLSCPKDFENIDSKIFLLEAKSPSQNTLQEKTSETKFAQHAVKTFRMSCNPQIEQQDESFSPASEFANLTSSVKIPNFHHNKPRALKEMAESSGCAEDKRLSNPTKNNRDVTTDNIVRIPLPLTGDKDIDEEIIAFYKAKQSGNYF